ncbi:sulfotransferase family 2 domain-containing protein [uncultured Tateyamaria sp.]|uniref:sulfotransferase family 2 domain-containing protein n=1 Tax=Tateyamaria sp. 1078 TaxID=3417464 RepID=UPI002602BC28|nr:sulfotransferase family 2 domain-containing protein [uncultured Tateyamaria sp.]
MPVVRARDKWLYFAHVPKCAGTAIERYLETRFGPLGLRDPSYGFRDPAEAWSLTPPQHMPEAVRRELLPDALFDGIFATVRHPVTRLRSAFLFQRDVGHALPPKMSFQRWVETVPRSVALGPYTLHGHLRPMVEFVPENAEVFRMEDGLDAVVGWIDAVTGLEDGPREIAPANVLADRIGDTPEAVHLTPRVLDTVAMLYAADFERFGYPKNPKDMEGAT